MIRRLWLLIGRVAYWVSRPLLYVYLCGSRRTRVLVVHGDEVLMVQGWLSDGRWLLPGGGLGRHEAPADGAVRELREETGIDIDTSKLQLVIADRHVRQRGLSFRLYGFVTVLDSRPVIRRSKIEITREAWIRWQDLLRDHSIGADTRYLLEAFYKE